MDAPPLGPDDLPLELHFEIYKEVFRSPTYDVDLTRLGSRKAPEWIESLALWQIYWKTVRLYVPGEAWYRVDRNTLQSACPGKMYLQPWRISLHRMLRFADRLFCYPEQAPSDLYARREDFPHPARLRDAKPPKSIEFEVLCPFDHKGAVGGVHKPIFGSREEVTNFRALIWLFKILQCHHPENRSRLDIALKWKDIRYTRPKNLILECNGGQENVYFYTEDPSQPTKAPIPSGLGIKERYLQIINQGLEIYSAYLFEREVHDTLTPIQKAEVPKSKYWAQCPANAPDTFKIGLICARYEIHQRNFVNRLAVNICQNLRNRVFDYSNNTQLAYLEFWQRATLDIAPPLPGEMYYNGLTQEFLQYVDSHVPYTASAIWEFNADPKGFVKKHNVQGQASHFFKDPLNCEWTLANYIHLGKEALKPWNDDSEDEW